ncbi:murein hydrolase activator EnvC family protein (plasmid) [Clostridium perfringens]
MKKGLKFVTSCLVTLSFANTIVSAAPKDKINENKNKIEQMEKEKENIKSEKNKIDSEVLDLMSQLDAKQEEIDKVQAEVDILQKEINLLQDEINEASNKIASTENKISDIEKDYNEQSNKQKYQEEVLRGRLRRNYINNTYNEFLGIILDSDSLSEVLFKIKYVNDIMKMDKDIINSLKETKVKLEETKEVLDREKELLDNQRASLEFQKKNIKDKQDVFLEQKAVLDKEYSDLDKIENQKQERIRELMKTSSDIDNQIHELESENAKLIEDMQSASSNSGNVNVSNKGFIRPAKGRYTSMFGSRVHPITGVLKKHTGVDIANGYGTPIYASDSGKVVRASYYGGFGKAVIIDHGNGYSTLYAHMQAFNVSAGDVVKQGQLLGEMGSTGLSTGPHVHFEVWKNGVPQNPMDYL